VSDQAMLNTAPPEVRCGMCGGRARVWQPGWIECASGSPEYGRCSWSSHDPRRRKHPLWWALRVWLGR
jgi:hypothetical protein